MKLKLSTSSGKARITTDPKAGQVEYVINATHHIPQGNAWYLVRNATSVDERIITVHVVDPSK